MSSPAPPAAAAARLRELFEQDLLEEAEAYAHALIAQHPREPFFPNALGNIRKERMDLDGAAAAYRAATEVDPAFAEAWINAGHMAVAQLQFTFALDCFDKALALKPDSSDAWFGRGRALQLTDALDAAEAAYKKAIELKPDFALAYNNLGCVYQEKRDYAQSESCLRRALELKPDHGEAVLNLAVTLGKQDKYEEAEQWCRKALELKPDDFSAHNNLGKILCDAGRLAPAIASYREALRLAPERLSVHSNLLFTLNYLGDAAPDLLFEEALRYGASAAQLVETRYTTWQSTAGAERLRVGIVSGDLMNHPVGYFLESILQHIDPARIELLAFPTRGIEDELTRRIRPYFSAWQPLTGVSDATAAELVHEKAPHILLDLAGHTGHNRLGMFAFKPAPVQVSWLGYFATTGLTEMDYLLADPAGVPADQQQYFSERIEYLPDTRLCFTAPEQRAEPNALPALTQNWVTFGCFQKMSKITDSALQLWARVLAAVPRSRMLVQCQSLQDPTVVEAFRQRLRAAGIDPKLVRMYNRMKRERYLQQYHMVDMLLDTFPYPGGTTTCEALWMGVPTLTLAGDSLLARQGVSLLTAAGLPQWIAMDEDDYVAKAQTFARDLTALADLRASLRTQFLASTLCDAPRFARNLEESFWRMWRGYKS